VSRIVSLVPSITELLFDLGLGAQVVGRTGFCIHPWEQVRHVPKVGGTKDLRFDVIRELRPTHVIVNIDENRREDAEALAEFVPELVVTHPLAPRDNLALYRQMGSTFGVPDRAEALCERFEAAYAKLVAGRDAADPEPVIYLIWRDPWMTVAPQTYISAMLALAGWQTLPRESGERYPEIDLAAHAGQVRRVLLSSEPFHFKASHLAEVRALVPGAEVSLIDGEMTSWYGSRAIQGLGYLAARAQSSPRV
jgi:ABC-type Fe3+-hydroxamate transport system substrate-binding protein